MGNLFRFRLSGHLEDGLNLLIKKYGYTDPGDAVRSLLRDALTSGRDHAPINRIGKENANIQAIVDELILEGYTEGRYHTNKLEKEAFVRHLLDEARCRNTGRNQRYWLCLPHGRTVGPHRMERLQEWVALEIIPDEWRVGLPGKEPIPMAYLHDFGSLGPSLQKKLTEYKSAPRPHWWNNPVTRRQLKKLEFFNLPFKRDGLTRGRASEYLEHFALIDPHTDQEYEKQKRESKPGAKKTEPPMSSERPNFKDGEAQPCDD